MSRFPAHAVPCAGITLVVAILLVYLYFPLARILYLVHLQLLLLSVLDSRAKPHLDGDAYEIKMGNLVFGVPSGSMIETGGEYSCDS